MTAIGHPAQQRHRHRMGMAVGGRGTHQIDAHDHESAASQSTMPIPLIHS